MIRSFIMGGLVGITMLQALAADGSAVFEGSVVATLTHDRVTADTLRFTRKAHQLRIEDIDRGKLDPINLLDLATKKATIVYLHNSTFVELDLTASPAPNARPSIPSNTELPNNPGMSRIAGMPMIPIGGAGLPSALTKTDRTRKIQGFDCTCYTVSDRTEHLEIWAMTDAGLFPFHLLERNPLRFHPGPALLEEQWAELMRRNSLFPLEATLRTEGGSSERFTFKVDRIEKKVVAANLFAVPEHYSEAQLPSPHVSSVGR